MAERTPFLLRLDPDVLEALRHWANDDMRSLNGHIEFLLRRSLKDAGRLPERGRQDRQSQARRQEMGEPVE